MRPPMAGKLLASAISMLLSASIHRCGAHYTTQDVTASGDVTMSHQDLHSILEELSPVTLLDEKIVSQAQSSSPSSASAVASTLLRGTHIRSGEGLCLDAGQPFVKGSDLHMWPCDDENPQEKWDFDASTKQVKNSEGGLCLSVVDKARVELAKCATSDAAQQWQHDPASGNIISASGLCLDGSEVVTVKPCELSRSSQNWQMTSDSHCKLSAWSAFTECTRTCGEGLQKRVRAVESDPRNGGARCGHLVETRVCKRKPCAGEGDCQVGTWGQWSLCTHKCGSGEQTRTRDVVVQASVSGVKCPSLHEERACNTHGCAITFEKSAFAWDDHEEEEPAAQPSEAAKALVAQPSALEKEQQELLKTCESLSPRMAELTLDKTKLQDQLDEMTQALRSLQGNNTVAHKQLAALADEKMRLTSELMRSRMKVERLQAMLDGAGPAAEEAQAALESENARVTAQLRSAETANAKLQLKAHGMETCQKQKQELTTELDAIGDNFDSLQGRYTEQERRLANCTMEKRILATQTETAKDVVASKAMQHDVNKKLLEDCRIERDQLGVRVYQAENDVRTLNMSNNKQAVELESCQTEKLSQSDLLTEAQEASLSLTAEKKQLGKLLKECEKAQGGSSASSVLDSAVLMDAGGSSSSSNI